VHAALAHEVLRRRPAKRTHADHQHVVDGSELVEKVRNTENRIPMASGQRISRNTPTLGRPSTPNTRVVSASTVVTASTSTDTIAASSNAPRSDAHGS
jgi:hypothetical protein